MKHYISGQLRDPEYFQNNNGTEEIKPEVVEKEWGTEEIIYNESHCVKIMKLKPGQQVSLHWHQRKDETFILISGQLEILTVDKAGHTTITRLTDALDSFTLYSNTPHTFYCPEGQEIETVFIEASTMDQPDDSFRIYPSGPKGKYFINR